MRHGSRCHAAATAAALLAAGPLGARAQPALDGGRDVGPVHLYPDATVPGRYYYLPGPLTLVERDGRPALRFVLTRRVGTASRGSRGTVDHFAHLSFDVEQRSVHADAIAAARHALEREGIDRPDLRPLPLRGIEAGVVFAPLGGGAADTVAGGDFETARSAELGDSASGVAFGRRRYTLRLDRASAEAVWRTLRSGTTLVSFHYAYLARGTVGAGEELAVAGGLPGQDAAFHLEPARGTEEGPGRGVRAVRADAFSVELDPERDADLMQVIDLNTDRSPPAYGVLDVRCYDFRSGLRPDLALKLVHLEGEAVNGRTARQLVIFRADEPEAAVHRVRFPYAVRLDRPLRYRVEEVGLDGETVDRGWQERSWIGVLDVSTSRERLDALASSRGATDSLRTGGDCPETEGSDSNRTCEP